MSFNLITEGSKDYMKYVLQLSEAKSKSKSKAKVPMRPESMDVPDNGIRKPGSKPTQGGGRGIGGEELEVPVITKNKSELQPGILFGVKSSFDNLHPTNDKGELISSGGLDYITKIAQASSFIDAIDQNIPSLIKFGLGYGNMGSQMDMDPGAKDKKSRSSNKIKGSEEAAKKAAETSLGSGNVTVQSAMDELDKGFDNETKSSAGKFANKVLQYSKNLGALDPFNPLLGYKIGYDMLGGREIIKRTRDLGAAQAAGTESSMGHPSGFGYFGR